MPVTSVLIADMQVLLADALAWSLSSWVEFEIFDDRPTTGTEALQIAMERHPDVALIDYWTAEINGATVAREILARLPATRIMHLSWFHGPVEIEESMASGAVGFLPKSLRVPQIAAAIHRAMAGEYPVYEEELGRMVGRITRRVEHFQEQSERFNSLTPRELGVLRELAYGFTIDRIARRLEIRPRTVETHLRRILAKTGAQSQIEVVGMAKNQGLVP